MSINISTIFNEILKQIQDNPLITSCPNGIVSNVNSSSCPYSYSGSVGNTTTTGYYATYSIILSQIINAINLQLTSSIYSNNSTSTSQTINTNFTFAYVQPLILNGTASGSGQVYIPQYSVETCIMWGPDTGWCDDCWRSPFGTNWCVWYPCTIGWECIWSTQVGVPSTYSEYSNITQNYSYSLQVNNITGNSNISFTFSTVDPQIPGNVIYPVNISIPGVAKSTYYFHSFSISNTNIDFTSFSIDGVNFNLTDQDVKQILSIFGVQVSEYFLTYFSKFTYQININH